MSVTLGVNPLIWTNDDLPMLGDETDLATCLAEAAAAGFQGIELGRRFPRHFAALGPLLEAHALALASGWYSSRLLTRSVDEEIEAFEPHLRLMKACGVRAVVWCEVSRCTHLDRRIPLSRRPRLDRAAFALLCRRLDALAAYLEDQGLALAYHHHTGTVIEHQTEIEALMAGTRDSLGLLLDTGHLALAGGDSLSLIECFGQRIRHVHCKDVRAPVVAEARNRDKSFLDAVVDGVFTIPGDGDLDFDATLAALSQHGYRGWLISEAEQDPAIAPSRPLAERSFDFLGRAARRAGLEVTSPPPRPAPATI